MTGRLNIAAVRSAAASPIPTPSPLPPIGNPGTLGVMPGPGTVTFTLNGTPRWIIDVSRFSGTPSLTVQGTPQRETTVTLKNALLPGTQVPADFVLVIGPAGLLGTPGDIKFAFGGFHAQVVLERWLAGTQAMESSVTLAGDVCALGAASKLAVSGAAHAVFLPNWLMAVGAPSLATISGLGAPLPSDALIIKLLLAADPSISTHPKSKRTQLILVAGTHAWPLTPQVTDVGIGKLNAAPGLFNKIEIEAGEGSTGDVARELLATSSSATGLSLAVAGGITDLDGHPFALALASPSYAIAFDASADHSQGDQTFLTARFGLKRVFLVSISGFIW